MKTRTLDTGLLAALVIAKQSYLQRAVKGSNFLTWVFIAMAVLLPALLLPFGVRWQYAIGYGAGVPLAFVAIPWWAFLVATLAEQNKVGAQLVPGLRRRSIHVLIAAGVLACVVVGGLLALAVPEPVAPLVAVLVITSMLMQGRALIST